MRDRRPPDQPGPHEEHTFYRARIFPWLHLPGRPPLMRWTWVKIWAFGAMAGVTVALFQIQALAEREDAKREQVQVDTNYLNCLRGNELRRLQIDAESEPSPPLDLTPFASVMAAPPWFQAFIVEVRDASVAAAAAPIDPESRTGRRIALFEAQIRDCDAEWAGHSPGLRLPHPTTSTTGASGVTAGATTDPVPFEDGG